MTSSSAVLVLGLLGTIGVACTYDRPARVTDAGAGDDDTAVLDGSGEAGPTIGPATAFLSGKDEPAAFGCIGAAADAGAPISDAAYEAGADGAAPSGELIDIAVHVTGFGTGGADPLGSTKVDVFWNNTAVGDKPDVVGATTDGTGNVTVAVPAGNKAGYRVAGTSKLRLFYEFDAIMPTVPGAKMEWFGLTNEMWDNISLAVAGIKNYKLPDGTGVLAARVRDCNHHYVRNAVVSLVDTSTGGSIPFVTKCAEGICLIYMNDGELPAKGLTFTSRSGLFAIANIPASALRKTKVVARAMYGGASELRIIGQRDVEVIDQSISTQAVEP